MAENNIVDIKRLETLLSFDVMDTLPESVYDDITALAASICNTPTSLISLVDDERQFFKSHHGLDVKQTPLEVSFCKHVIIDNEDLLIVENTHEDERFANNLLVTEYPNIGFYAGASLTTTQGHRLGTLCVIDYEAKKLSPQQIASLKTLANQVVQLLELRRSKKIEEGQRRDLVRKGKLLDNIVKATGIGIWERNLKEDAIVFSSNALELLGISHTKEILIKIRKWLTYVHPDDLIKVKERYSNCFKIKSQVCELQYRMKHTDGHYIWVNEYGKVLTWNNENEPLLMYGTIQDITEKVNHREELERLKNNQEAMINSTKDLMWSIDLDFKLITANSSFHKLIKRNLGFSYKEGDYTFTETYDAETNNKWKAYFNRALKGETFSIKHKFEDPIKHWITYGLTSFNPLLDSKGKQIGITCFSKDITSEVLSQQVLLSAKEEMDKIMEASLDIICTMDEEGYFLSINKACKKIWGYEPKELIGTQYIDLVFEEDQNATQDSAYSLLAGEKETNFENRYVHKNGTLVPMLWSSNWDEKDCVYYCIARDNTEKKKAELQLENSERRFKTLVQEGTELIAIFDQEAKFIYVSPTSKNTIKMSPEELLGTIAFDHIHLDDHQEVYTQFLEVANKKQVYFKPFRFKNGEGKWRWLETIATNQIDEPSINGIVVNTRDVTEKKKAEELLENSERRFKTLVQEGSDIIGIINKHEIFSYVSPTSIKTLQISPEEFIGTNVFDYVHPDDYERIHCQFIKIFEIPQVTIGPFRFKHGNGSWIWMETIVTNKLDEPTINGIVVNSKDVTTRVRHINAIKLQNARLKEIAWTQSHIVRAPVARLMGLINLIKNENEGLHSNEKEEVLNFIFTSANEIDTVIRETVEKTASAIDIEEFQ
ncbi:PAS domain S-box protein [Maribacter hydrothermalis]|uniref:histidine kinase n=1 Tax=Maribacter hydrothermalis TaxID=1836467 RepID=A0A1B7Z3Q5_9FLAO|nr:PAS domain S-box protein [Maribacter hydrothermalis]APQ17082.1 hypothetical protein BTR34_06975 [Maribacter hydrothermalis]OBR37343.1 hypothetical protein A9200_06730 [Maribacter hydrothermalis]